MTSTSSPVRDTVAETVLAQIDREYRSTNESRKDLAQRMLNSAKTFNQVSPTTIYQFIQENADHAVYARVARVAVTLLGGDFPMVPEEVVAHLHRLATRELVGQGIVQHSTGTASDADLAERAAWARIYHMTDTTE